MSDNVNVNRLFNAIVNYSDTKEVELVESIVEKTKAGKIVWHKNPSNLSATLPGMQMSFVRPSNALLTLIGAGGGWDLFSVRKNDGTEILKVEQPQGKLLIAPAAPPLRSKLVQAVDTLYSVADAKGQGDIDSAINAIKNL